MAKLNLQQALLQSSVSHDPSQIILMCGIGAQETFHLIINVENNCDTFLDSKSLRTDFFLHYKFSYCDFIYI